VRRALFGALIEAQVEEVEPPADRELGVGLRAVLLDDLDGRRREARVASPRELVNWASFHPAVDQLLYAPQVAFPDVYFDGADEPTREAPSQARRPVATAPRLIALFEDALGAERARALSGELLGARRPYAEALDALD